MKWLNQQEKTMLRLPLAPVCKIEISRLLLITAAIAACPLTFALTYAQGPDPSVSVSTTAEDPAAMLGAPSDTTVGDTAIPSDVATPLSTSPSPVAAPEDIEEETVQPWDYSPYKILIWIASDDPRVNAKNIEAPLRHFLDREYSSIWRVTIEDAPLAVASSAQRDLSAIDFASLAGRDPVIAVKRDHKDAIRLRGAASVKQYIPKVLANPRMIDEVKRRGEAAGDATLMGVVDTFETFDGDAATKWTEPETAALLTTRGTAMALRDPAAKIIDLPLSELVTSAIDAYDKIFVVNIQHGEIPSHVSIVECHTLMRYFGAVVRRSYVTAQDLPDALGRGLTQAFSPEVRIDDAGLKTASGLVRAASLILDKESTSLVRKGDVLIPMIRKNDRIGTPILIGPIDWAYLLAVEDNHSSVKMEYYSGRPGGLQGRQNKRSFRRAIRIRTTREDTLLRLHAKKKPEFPLIGYELYEKELYSTKMTFIGRTDWNGRLNVTKTEDPLRLLYVKNGGAVLARLPIVPGLTDLQVADLIGDDMRLQAEAYLNGVNNAVIDLVSLRKLLGARIRKRLRAGEMEKAEALVAALRDQPSKEILSNDMDRKQAFFIDVVDSANGRRKVDNMFQTTREMLDTQITQKDIRDIEADLVTARKNGGKLPPEEKNEEEEYDASANSGDSAPAQGEGK